MPAAWKVQHLRDQRLNRSSLTSFGTGTFLHISIITLLSMSIQNWSFRCQPFSLKTMERKYSATEKKFHNLKTFIDSKCKILLYFRFIFVILEWGACSLEGSAPQRSKVESQFINFVLHWDFPSHFNHHVIINVNSELIFSLPTILSENNGEEIQCNTKEVS